MGKEQVSSVHHVDFILPLPGCSYLYQILKGSGTGIFLVKIQVKLRHLRERWTTPYVCVCMIRGQRNREKICECKKGGVAFQFHICRQPRQKKPFYLTPLKRFCPPFALHLTIHTIPCLIYLGQSPRNARIFTGNKIPGQKIS